MRQGELFALQWGDVDLDAGVVNVHAFARGDRRHPRAEAPPKSAKGRRRIDLPEFAVDALRDHRKRMLAGGARRRPRVLQHGGGTWLLKSNFTRRVFKPALKGRRPARGCASTTCGTGHATLMLAMGENPKVVQERLGHSQINLDPGHLLARFALPSTRGPRATSTGLFKSPGRGEIGCS